MSDAGDLLAGRYRLQRYLGGGAMGVVWQAGDERLHRTVAVKQLLLHPGPDAVQADEAQQRAMREGRIAARLHHPNAIAVHDVAEDSGRPVLVMEYLPSRSLADELTEHGSLAPHPAASIGAQAASALTAAHAAGIVHRDIKPANILLGDDGTVKITDFGISHAAGDVAVTRTGILAGTPAYLSPEVARGHRSLPGSDVFSLGATLYAAVEGRPPFDEEESAIAQLHAVADGRFPPPQHAGPLTPVLMGMLRVDPAHRLTMEQAGRGLQAVVAGQPLPEALDTTAPEWDTRDLGPVPTLPTVPIASTSHSGAPVATGHGAHPFHAGPSGTRVGAVPAGDTYQHRSPGRTRRRFLYTAAGVLATLLAGALLLFQWGSGKEDSTAQPAPPSTGARSVVPAELERTVSDYYALLPEHTDNAWARLGPAMQTRGRARYEEFWRTVTDVTTIAPPRTIGGKTVRVGIELTLPDGTRVREFHRLGMLVDDGTPLINSDALLRTERIPPPPPPAPRAEPVPDKNAKEDEGSRGGEGSEKHEDKKGKGKDGKGEERGKSEDKGKSDDRGKSEDRGE